MDEKSEKMDTSDTNPDAAPCPDELFDELQWVDDLKRKAFKKVDALMDTKPGDEVYDSIVEDWPDCTPSDVQENIDDMVRA